MDFIHLTELYHLFTSPARSIMYYTLFPVGIKDGTCSGGVPMYQECSDVNCAKDCKAGTLKSGDCGALGCVVG